MSKITVQIANLRGKTTRCQPSERSGGNWLVLRQPDAMNQILEPGVGPHIVIRRIHL